MFDRRYVYLMLRTKDNEAEIIVCHKLFFARKIEQRLHKRFGDSRFTMTKRIRYRKWGQNHIKIGIATNPKSRQSDVSRNIFKSGKTEWFAINDLEYFFMYCTLWWYAYKWRVGLVFICLIVGVITEQFGIEIWSKLYSHLLGT